MRGTRVDGIARLGVLGIIPAYAGNTDEEERRRHPRRDHPRVCGEHVKPSGVFRATSGSSPRMRGTQAVRVPSPSMGGIIPAYAGNTSLCAYAFHCHRDHPRVCGEHVYCPPPEAGTRGSSPRMRGTLAGILYSLRRTGIIPAYAGNTILAPRSIIQLRDHPRVCGEHL